MATNLYHNLPKLARVQLPSGNEYALIDYNGRELVAPFFNTAATYLKYDLVIYEDNLYRFVTNHSAGAWNSAEVVWTNVDEEIKRIWDNIKTGIHYIGVTTTPIYDGDQSHTSIVINGSSVTAKAGDLVMLNITTEGVATEIEYNDYPVDISANTYYKCWGTGWTAYYFCRESHTGVASVEEMTNYCDLIYNTNGQGSPRIEFIWSGDRWDALGGPTNFGELAFKDSAEGDYIAPTGAGTVVVKEYTVSSGTKMVTTSITGVGGTTTASKVTSGTPVAVASAGTAIGVGTALTGDTTFVKSAIGSVTLGSAKTFNTNAIKSATLTGETTFATEGVTIGIGTAQGEGDCLVFSTAGTNSVGISTTAADTGTVSISTEAAATGQVTLATTNINPAVSNGTITPVTASDVTVATAASNPTTVATGSVSSSGSGASLVTDVTGSDVTKSVIVGTGTGHIVVK